MLKRVIFVAGADFSGTTMLDLVLGSIDGATSLGELSAVLEPTAEGHGRPCCTCRRDDCDQWPSGLRVDARPYHRLAERRDRSTLIDSSKHPAWIAARTKALRAEGVEVDHVLIWKDPADYARSCINRGKAGRWAAKWILYHRALAETGLVFRTVELARLIADPEPTVRELEQGLTVGLDTSCLRYWRHAHHAAFGSRTARLKLHEPGTPGWEAERAASIKSVVDAPISPDPFDGQPAPVRRELVRIHRELQRPQYPAERRVRPGASYHAVGLKRAAERRRHLGRHRSALDGADFSNREIDSTKTDGQKTDRPETDRPEGDERLSMVTIWRRELVHVNKTRDTHLRLFGRHFDHRLLVRADRRIGEHITGDGTEVTTIDASGPFGDAVFLVRSLLEARRLRPDLLTIPVGHEPILPLARLLLGRGTTIVSDLWDVPSAFIPGSTRRAVKMAVFRRLEPFLVRSADVAVVGVAPEALPYLSSRGGSRPTIVPSMNGVDLDRFNHRVPNHPIWSTSVGGLRLLYVGAVHRTRGSVAMVDALAALVARGNDPVLVLAGDGERDEFELLRRRAADAGVDHRLVLAGPVPSDEVPSLVAGADVCLSPLDDIAHYRHSFPVKVAEYMAMGKRIVATDLPGTRRMLADYPAGTMIADVRADLLADHIEALASGPEPDLTVWSGARLGSNGIVADIAAGIAAAHAAAHDPSLPAG